MNGRSKKKYLHLLLICSWHAVFAQNNDSKSALDNNKKVDLTITGELINTETQTPVEFASIGLFKTGDSSFVSGSTADSKGQFKISCSVVGKFYMKIGSIGYETKYISPIILSEKKHSLNLGVIEFNSSATNLQEVEIAGTIPLYQVYADKKVYNVEQDPASVNSSTADMLQNIPSVFVEQNGRVKLRGSNVTILIDGKPSGLLGIRRAQVLDYIPANMIESIEVIDNPSSQYDANGEGGIINIILKKPKQPGLNGIIRGSVGTEGKYAGSANVNYRGNKLTVYGSYDARIYNMMGTTVRNREIRVDDTTYDYLNQTRNWTQKNTSNNARLRMDYVYKKNEWSASILYKIVNQNDTAFADYERFVYLFSPYNDPHFPWSTYKRSSEKTNKDKSLDYSVSYVRKFNRKGQLLKADFLYTTNVEDNADKVSLQYHNLVVPPFNPPQRLQNIMGFNKQYNSIGRVDYTQPFNKKGEIETGFKSIMRYSDMDYSFLKYDTLIFDYASDSAFTNHFNYKENVNSFYATYNNKYKRFSYKAGMRAEQTITNSNLETKAISYNKNYIDFFPAVHLLQKLKKNNSIGFSYTKRINRPEARMLNPFVTYANSYTIRTGNPNLKSEYTHSFNLSHSKPWKNTTVNSSLYYRYTSDPVQKLSSLDSTFSFITTTYDNFLKDQDMGAELYFNIRVCKWYRFNTSLNGYRSIIDGTNIHNTYKSDSYTWNGKVNNTFTIGKKFTIQWTGSYQAATITPFIKKHPVYFSDISMKKDFLKNKLTVSLRISDIFLSKKQISEINNLVYKIYRESKQHSRILFLSLIYRPFGGKFKIKESPQSSDIELENIENEN